MGPLLSEFDARRQIVRACRALHERGLVAAFDGNVSARLPSGSLIVTPAGASKGDVSEDALLLCSPEGRRIRGAGQVSTEVQLHVAAYRARRDVRAVVHAHPPLASAFTFAGVERLLLEPVLPEVVARLGKIPAVPYATPGSLELGRLAEPFLARHDAVLLAQHGAVTLGGDPWSAYLLMEKLEHAATILKAARELAGSEEAIRRLTPAQVAELMATYGKAKGPPRR
ncbi:MAG: class II aldolase/adducin family protein [Elusimicrobia bacterium]|nr:class II aldolase/adducin family protein [Elusimicrobiota bacterium]